MQNPMEKANRMLTAFRDKQNKIGPHLLEVLKTPQDNWPNALVSIAYQMHTLKKDLTFKQIKYAKSLLEDAGIYL